MGGWEERRDGRSKIGREGNESIRRLGEVEGDRKKKGGGGGVER